MTLGRDKTHENPSLNFKGISFVISNIVTPNIVTPNIVTPNIVTPNIITPYIVTRPKRRQAPGPRRIYFFCKKTKLKKSGGTKKI